MTMQIFDDFIRRDASLRKPSQSDYEYLNQSARVSAQHLRQIMNIWFEEYNEEIQESDKINDLKSRLQSKKNDQYRAAFFELYIFILLKRMGFQIVAEPTIPGYTTKPDFLATCPYTGKEFYLEATTVTEGDINSKRDKAIELVTEKINKHIPCSHYIIELGCYGVCKEQDVNKEIIKEIKSWINNTPLKNPKKFEFENWVLSLKAQKVSNPLNFKEIIVTIDSKVQCLNRKTDIKKEGVTENRMDAMSRIREAILGKSKKYGQLDKPYIIAINMHSDFFNRISLFEALLGKEVTYDYGNGEVIETRLDGGLWRKGKETISISVNGVLSFFDLTPWKVFLLKEMPRKAPLFILNPHIKQAFPFPEFMNLLDENSCLLDLQKLESLMRLPEEDLKKELEEDW
jgi:hypothetical protein